LIGEAQQGLPDFLVLEWLPPVRPQNPSQFAEKLGEGLATLHLQMADQYGLDRDNFIGSLPQENQQENGWARFYAEHRILFQMEIARQVGRLTPERERLLNTLCQNMSQLAPDDPPASLLHGDLWGGNYLGTTHDVPVIYDPAVYYGHREVEMAFTELFGGFPTRFYDAYNAVYPLDQGYAERKALYQLYPLMVHMNLFGGGYIGQVDRILRHYLGSP
jgi:fructosamine-3-kinase